MLDDYLLIIDATPVDNDFKEYFMHFSIGIQQKQHLDLLELEVNQPYALIISSVILEENHQLLNELYTRYQLPLLISSEKRNDALCIRLLEEGADDFVVTPLPPRELHARIKAIKRRCLKSKQRPEREIWCFMDWRVDPASRQLFNKNKVELFLSVGEYELLLIFLQNPQKILERELLLQLTKNTDLGPFDRRIDIQISRLRQKIEKDAKKPCLIKTIRNVGYIFTATVEIAKET